MKNVRYQGFTKEVHDVIPVGYINRMRSRDIHALLQPAVRERYSIQKTQGRIRRMDTVESEKVFSGNGTCYQHKLYWRTV